MSDARVNRLPEGFWSELLSDSNTNQLAQLGSYPLKQVIWRDSNKAVFESIDTLTDRPLRIAIFKETEVNLEEMRSRILPGHDFLYPVHDILTISNHPILIMPGLKGTTLKSLLASRPQIEIKKALRIAQEILVALTIGQQRGLIHGFLSPDWIWLEEPTQNVRMMGLGWRLLEPSGAGELAAFLASGSEVVPAPEVTEGKPQTHQGDLFHVGMILYQILTGQAPFSGHSPLEIIRALAIGDVRAPSTIRSGLDPAIDQFVMSLLSRKPEDRPESAHKAALFIRELEQTANLATDIVPEATKDPERSTVNSSNAFATASSYDYENIELAPLEHETPRKAPEVPLRQMPVQEKAVETRSPVQDEENELIDFAEPLSYSGQPRGTGLVGEDDDDDMLIGLLPIDDRPSPTSTNQHASRNSGIRQKTKAVARESAGDSYTSLRVPIEWVFIADSAVEAIHLASETQKILIRDQTGKVVVLSGEGEIEASEQSPEPVRLSAGDQAGQLVAMVLGKRLLAFFDWDLNLLVEKRLHSEPVALAVDSLGLYVAVSFLGRETRIYNRQGRQVAEFETRQPLARMEFVPGSSRLVGSTTFDQLVCAEIEPMKGNQFDAEIQWVQNTGIGIGDLHIIGDSGKILASCNNMGLQRLNLEGENEGTYQLGGTVIESAADFPGRFFLASTLEGVLLAVNASGSILWEHSKGGPWRHLCVDSLGRYALASSALGEVVCLDLSTEPKPQVDHSNLRIISSSGTADSQTSSVKSTSWSIRVAEESENTSSFSLAISDHPFRACLLDSKKRLSCFTIEGDEAESLQPLGGAGRLLKACHGWVAAGNDRVIQLLNLSSSQLYQPDLSLVQVTHFEMNPAKFGLLIIQEGDRLGRAAIDGRWIWKVHLPATVESLILADDGYAAVSLDNSQVGVIGANGKGVGKWSAGEQEAVLLCQSQARQNGQCRWISLARSERVLRGHSLDLRVLWQVETPFAPWELISTEQGTVVVGNDQSALLYDDSGEIISRRRGTNRPTIFSSDKNGRAIALHSERELLFCTNFDGSVIWRVAFQTEISAMSLSSSGALVLSEGILSWILMD